MIATNCWADGGEASGSSQVTRITQRVSRGQGRRHRAREHPSSGGTPRQHRPRGNTEMISANLPKILPSTTTYQSFNI